MRTERGGGLASPPYPFRHSGPVLVCGNAFCLHDDFERARARFPDAAVIAVNGAAREVQAFALYSRHPERFVERGYEWIRRQEKFGHAFTIHSSNVQKHGRLPWVDHWWEDARGLGGSSWGARKLAWLMGFDLAVLCGCPLEPGNYAGHRPGMLMTRPDVIQKYRDGIAAETEWHEGCISMSGWTAEFLGC